MQSLREVLSECDRNRAALGHFNVSDLAGLQAVTSAAARLRLPVLIGVSEGERQFLGIHEIVALVRSMREDLDIPIFLNADHTHTLPAAREAAIAGFDEVIIDASKLPFEENIKLTRATVETLRIINPDVIIEGEIGYIGSGSEIQSSVPEESLRHTTVEEARRFIAETHIDVLAPAVGNMHGLLSSMVKGEEKKHLDITRIKELKAATGKFMTLHGGSGTADEDFTAAIEAGITIVHVSTELRLAWREGVEESLKEHPQELAPYKILTPAIEEISKVVEQRLKLFNANRVHSS